jgi:hypothetical protein
VVQQCTGVKGTNIMDDFGGIVGGLIGLCIGLPILAIYIYSIIWAYGDAERSGANRAAW